MGHKINEGGVSIESAKICDRAGFKLVPKSDLHNHAGRGGNISYISKSYNTTIAPPSEPFKDLNEMQHWFEVNIKAHCIGLKGYLKRLEAAFVHARNDHIAVLSMSFSKSEIDILGGMEPFIVSLTDLHSHFAPQIRFLPELTFGREQNEKEILSWLDEILSFKWFKSVDICNDEFAQPIRNFRRVYEVAQKHNLRLKAHVGEFGSADDVQEAVETLHLHEVHHGIAAAQSKQIMKWLAKHNVQLNICPTSNIMLGRAKDYRTHPIKTLFDYGVPVTINTDDMLIFDSSVSQEYEKLFDAGAFNYDELEHIREQGISVSY